MRSGPSTIIMVQTTRYLIVKEGPNDSIRLPWWDRAFQPLTDDQRADLQRRLDASSHPDRAKLNEGLNAIIWDKGCIAWQHEVAAQRYGTTALKDYCDPALPPPPR